MLRRIVLDCGLVEEYKWSQPCYTFRNKNILILIAFKDYACISFFKGSLLEDPEGILITPGKNSQAARQLRYTDSITVKHQEAIIRNYIHQAIEVEKSGLEVRFEKQPEPVPTELRERMDSDEVFRKAFESLTPGRQRGYILYFSQPKQSKTRVMRIEKYTASILNGEGMQDVYRNQKGNKSQK
jgi:uncharacterized protein YdeI (YjbR/CyaY-like superfamily)